MTKNLACVLLDARTWAYKAVAFTLAAMFAAAVSGMFYVPQKRNLSLHTNWQRVRQSSLSHR